MRLNRSYYQKDTPDEDLLTFFVPEPKPQTTPKQQINSRRFDLQSLLILSLSFLIGFYLGYDVIFTNNSSSFITTKSSSVFKSKNSKLHNQTKSSTSIEILGQLYKQRRILEDDLMKNYGNYYTIFFEENGMNQLFHVSEASNTRLIRRLMIKILQSKLNNDGSYSDHHPTYFHWISAGDSSAYGYGNLFSESYTSILEESVKKAFEIVGMNFVAGNYAMDNQETKASLLELGLCIESIYGSDIDILSWDFSSIKDHSSNDLLWSNRALVHPSKPILFLQDSSFQRFKQFHAMETAGLSAILFKLDALYNVQRQLPNASLKDKEGSFVDQSDFPKAIQYFNCNDNIEGDGVDDGTEYNVCRDYKYRNSTCDTTQFRKRYNPGWKSHLLKGKIISLYLLNTLIETCIQLDTILQQQSSSSKTTTQHDFLEHKKYKNLLQTLLNKNEYDNNLYQYFPPSRIEWTDSTDYNNEMRLINEKRELLFHGRSMCRTTIQPLGRRHNLRFVQEDRASSSYSFDGGMNFIRVDKPFKLSSTTSYYDNYKDRTSPCYNEVKFDSYSYYDIRYENKWIGTTFPNATEEFSMGVSHVEKLLGKEGFILLCFDAFDDRDDVIERTLDTSTLLHDKVEIKVNKNTVVDLLEMDGGCYFLKGLGGYTVWKDDDGDEDHDRWKIHLLFRVFDPNLRIRLRSIITTFH